MDKKTHSEWVEVVTIVAVFGFGFLLGWFCESPSKMPVTYEECLRYQFTPYDEVPMNCFRYIDPETRDFKVEETRPN